ncbi:uncharacterized protein [Neodiprion pinetum]|uniref:Uncharacterized protein LOC107225503 isoform X1 n=1 Tax=Neodiprion lecontei TaxID=441921 RepID=A0ABM3G8J7_NEOLC|nr:uncharacterized protein LOC124218677 isoform X1 [Neodiprion pinetum]XP_046596593.1 uncharacterized protein LOC107225503 isoform X1 [Neodiprion lecontei]
MRRVCFLVTLIILVTYVAALDEKSSKQAAFGEGDNAEDEDDSDYDDYDYALEDKKGHKIKRKHKLYLSKNAGCSTVNVSPFAGGLKSLAAFIAIKIKIILVVITVIGIIGFTLKVFGALKYIGYLGGGCPVVHEPAHGLGYSVTPPPDHVPEYGSWGNTNDWSSSGSWARSLVQSYIDTDMISHALKNMDMAEMVFSTLEMNDDVCRRRLVCEIDAKTREFPLLSYAMDFFSHGFEKFKTSSKVKFSDCAKLYASCDDEKKSRRRRKRFVDKTEHRNQSSV